MARNGRETRRIQYSLQIVCVTLCTTSAALADRTEENALGSLPTIQIDRVSPDTIEESWKSIYQGVEAIAIESETPRLMKGKAIRIDLDAPGIRFFVSPSNGDRPLEADSIQTSEFLDQFDLQIAINAAPFSPVVREEGVPQDIVGLAISDGELVSDSHDGYGALLVYPKNQAKLVVQPPKSLEGVVNACGGFRLLLVDGENVGEGSAIHPRSAVGLTESNRTLILLAIDGRQPGHSGGATLGETAEWLQKLGCTSALNLDGGGSSSLVVSEPDGRPLILNQPIQSGVPGRERPCPNHLGLFAAPRVNDPPTPSSEED